MVIMKQEVKSKKHKKTLTNGAAPIEHREGSAVESILVDEPSVEDTPEKEPVSQEVLLLAQEVNIVKNLACNDLNKRLKQLRKLPKWFQLRSRSSFRLGEENFLRIWKGLYYTMWMSDKPLVQEDLSEQLSKLLFCFEHNVEASVDFFGAFIKTMCLEWFGLDQWRMDKFMLLVRRMLRYMFRVLKQSGWQLEHIRLLNRHLKSTIMSEDDIPALGLCMHFLDIYFEELAKVAESDIGAEQVGEFVRPFVGFVAVKRDPKLLSHCRSRVFYHLLYQSSLGREYQEKYDAWKRMGFPTESINDLEKAEDDKVESEDEDNTENIEGEEDLSPESTKELDPRAGNVDVIMPELPLDAKYIIEELEGFIYKKDTSTKCRKSLRKLQDLFKTYQNGEFPLGVKRMPRFERQSDKPLIKEKLENLENLENEFFGLGRKLKLMNKRKRKKLLSSLNYENVEETELEKFIENALPKDYIKEKQQKARLALMSGWVEEELDKDERPAKKAKMEKHVSAEQTDKVKAKKKKLLDTQGDKEETPVKLVKVNKKKESPLKEINQSKSVNAKKSKCHTKVEKEAAEETPKTNGNAATATWDTPLAEGEVEYFIPSRKLLLKKANKDLVPNPFAKVKAMALNHGASSSQPSTPLNSKRAQALLTKSSSSTGKRVKIALKLNTEQKPHEYIQQVKRSPHLPYDANKKPGKGLLKPNAMPSPINPYYKKKIGLTFKDTM